MKIKQAKLILVKVLGTTLNEQHLPHISNFGEDWIVVFIICLIIYDQVYFKTILYNHRFFKC